MITTAPDRVNSIGFASEQPLTVLQWDTPGLSSPIGLHVVEAPAMGEERGPFLLMHGEPSWSHLYGSWIPALTTAGYRCIAPNLPGFVRSDKPTDEAWYTYERHCDAVRCGR